MAQEKWLVDSPKVIDVEGVRALKVGLIAGQVSVVGSDEPGARIEIHSVSGRDLKVSLDGTTLEVDHAQLRWDNFLDVFRSFIDDRRARADVTITVPRDVALTFGVVTASGLITGLAGGGQISTVSGDLVVDSLSGRYELNAVNGEVSVRDHTGTITAHSVGGDITVSGELETLAADTVTGDVFADLAGIPGDVRVNTVSGNVTMRLAADVAAQYKLNTVAGRLQLDDSTITGVRGSYTAKFGVLDKNWVDFRANTVSGNISVLHAVSA